MSARSVLLLAGAVGAGKTDTSYRIFDRLWRAGVRTARLDLDDLGECHPAPDDDEHNHRVKAAVLGAAWPTLRDRGTERLVLAGGVETADQCARYRAQVADADWTVVRLRLAQDELLRQRLRVRASGFGMTDQQASYWIGVGADEERHLDGESFFDHVVSTSDVDREGAVDRVLEAVGWSAPVSPPRP
jgi:hypothetical protein